jgi:hypothetical protein
MSEPKPTPENIRQIEDSVAEQVANMADLVRATMYENLHANGMTLQRAHEIRVKAGAVN